MALSQVAPDLLRELSQVVQDPDEWLNRENDQLGGQKPNELIAAGKEQLVRDLIEAIKHGMHT
jgi:uncharacterized protein (DUF2384 family)